MGAVFMKSDHFSDHASAGFLHSKSTRSSVSSSAPHFQQVASMFVYRDRSFPACKHPALAFARRRLPVIVDVVVHVVFLIAGSWLLPHRPII